MERSFLESGLNNVFTRRFFTGSWSSFWLFLVSLDHVTIFIFKFYAAFGLVALELTINFASFREEDSSAANSSIIDPLAIIEITIFVVVNAGSVAHVVLKVSFVVFAILKQDFNLAINDAVPIKSALNKLIRESEQCTVTLGASISPFTLVDGTSCSEFAKTGSVAHVRLPLSLVNVSVGENLLATALLNALGHSSLVNVIRHCGELSQHFIHHSEPVAGDSLLYLFGNAKGLVIFSFCHFLLLNETRFRIVVLRQKL